MAAPAYANRRAYQFRDAKGQTARMTVLIGAADAAGFAANADTLRNHLVAMTNAYVSQVGGAVIAHTLGAAATYLDVEDKAQLTFLDVSGRVHRYAVAAPISAAFQADGETVNAAQAAVAAVIADIVAFGYGSPLDTAPLAYVGGIRGRARFKRRFNIFTKNPTLTDEGE